MEVSKLNVIVNINTIVSIITLNVIVEVHFDGITKKVTLTFILSTRHLASKA